MQLALNIAGGDGFGAGFFIEDSCNQQAYRVVNEFPNFWTSNCVVIIGEEKSGKTSLAKIWQKKANAKILKLDEILKYLQSDLKENIIIEDIEKISEDQEEFLFHLYNRLKISDNYLLLNSNVAIFNLKLKLADLKSRIDSSIIVNISPITLDFQKVLLQKAFLERQLKVNEKVIDYIMPRMERSYKAVFEIAEILNKKSIETKNNITIPFVKDLIFEK